MRLKNILGSIAIIADLITIMGFLYTNRVINYFTFEWWIILVAISLLLLIGLHLLKTTDNIGNLIIFIYGLILVLSYTAALWAFILNKVMYIKQYFGIITLLIFVFLMFLLSVKGVDNPVKAIEKVIILNYAMVIINLVLICISIIIFSVNVENIFGVLLVGLYILLITYLTVL